MMKPCNIHCPKCGSMDVYRLFRAKGTKMRVDYGDNTPKTNKWQRWDDSYGGVSLKDHIDHHCRMCQYDWQGAPL